MRPPVLIATVLFLLAASADRSRASEWWQIDETNYLATSLMSNYLAALKERCIATFTGWTQGSNAGGQAAVYEVYPPEYVQDLLVSTGMYVAGKTTQTVITAGLTNIYVYTNWAPLWVTNKVTNYIGPHVDAGLMAYLDWELDQLMGRWSDDEPYVPAMDYPHSPFLDSTLGPDGDFSDALRVSTVATSWWGQVTTNYRSAVPRWNSYSLFSALGIGMIETSKSVYGMGTGYYCRLTRSPLSSNRVVLGELFPVPARLTLSPVNTNETSAWDGEYLYQPDQSRGAYKKDATHWLLLEDEEPYWLLASGATDSLGVGMSSLGINPDGMEIGLWDPAPTSGLRAEVAASNAGNYLVFWRRAELDDGAYLPANTLPGLRALGTSGPITVTLLGRQWYYDQTGQRHETGGTERVHLSTAQAGLTSRWHSITGALCGDLVYDGLQSLSVLYDGKMVLHGGIGWYPDAKAFEERFALLRALKYTDATTRSKRRTYTSHAPEANCDSSMFEPPWLNSWPGDRSPNWYVSDEGESAWTEGYLAFHFDAIHERHWGYNYSNYSFTVRSDSDGVEGWRYANRYFVFVPTGLPVDVDFYALNPPIDGDDASCTEPRHYYGGGRADWLQKVSACAWNGDTYWSLQFVGHTDWVSAVSGYVAAAADYYDPASDLASHQAEICPGQYGYRELGSELCGYSNLYVEVAGWRKRILLGGEAPGRAVLKWHFERP